MKITNKELKQIIKEELENVMNETYFSDPKKMKHVELEDEFIESLKNIRNLHLGGGSQEQKDQEMQKAREIANKAMELDSSTQEKWERYINHYLINREMVSYGFETSQFFNPNYDPDFDEDSYNFRDI